MLNPDLDKIPQELKERRQWVCFGPDKVPINPKTGRKAEADNPDTWASYAEAVKFYKDRKNNGIAGLGYEFSYYDKYTGADIDGCLNPETGEVRFCARVFLKYMNSYSEKSPSGTGTHTIANAKWPMKDGNSKTMPCGMKFEFYGVDRYFTMTGHHLPGTPANIEHRQEELTALHRAIFAKPKDTPRTASTPPALDLSDQELIDKACGFKDGVKFERLWRGDATGYDSPSEADYALVHKLAFLTNKDPERIDRLFRQSGLCQNPERLKKWERLAAKTIERAIANTPEGYTPGGGGDPNRKRAQNSSKEEITKDQTKAPEPTQEAEGNTPTLADVALPVEQFINLDMAPRRSLLHPWLQEASIGMIHSYRGVGKTNLGISIAEAVARGIAFGPWEAGVGGRVLYLDAELPMQDASARLIELLGDLPPNFIFLSDHLASARGLPKAALSDENWRQEFKNLLVKLQVNFWVADNIASLTPGIDENDKAAWDPVNQYLLELRFAGIASLLQHHSGKSGAQRGTSGREDNLDYVISLSRPKSYKQEDGCRFIASFEKSRVRQKDLFLISDTDFQLVVDENGKYTWTSANARQKDKTRILPLFNGGFSGKDIAESVGVTQAYVSKIKKKAISDGYLTEGGKLTASGLILVNSEVN